jgi:hypothetical protein
MHTCETTGVCRSKKPLKTIENGKIEDWTEEDLIRVG